MELLLNEIYTSIQGEGLDAGCPTNFIRFQGCNLWKKPCRWCDTPKAREPKSPNGFTVDVDTIENLLKDKGINTDLPFCITGGEPLRQVEALRSLVHNLSPLYPISVINPITVETNGTIPPPSWVKMVHWSVDVKCPSSGVTPNLDILAAWLEESPIANEFKFVVAEKKDLDFVDTVLWMFKGGEVVPLISPVFKNGKPDLPLPLVVEFAISRNLRLSLQLHKLIWGDKEGV